MTNDEIIASGDDSEINKQILEYEKRMNKFIKDLIKNQEENNEG